MKYLIFFLISINIFAINHVDLDFDFDFGVKAGINFNNIYRVDDRIGRDIPNSYATGFSLGFLIKVNLSKYVYLSTEFLYNRKGFRFIEQDYEDENSSDYSRIVDYLEYPFIFGLKYKGFYGYLGYYYATFKESGLICNKGKYCSTHYDDYDGRLADDDKGVLMGVGYQLFNKYLFDFRFSRGTKKINLYDGDEEYSTGIDFFYQYILSIGYIF